MAGRGGYSPPSHPPKSATVGYAVRFDKGNNTSVS